LLDASKSFILPVFAWFPPLKRKFEVRTLISRMFISGLVALIISCGKSADIPSGVSRQTSQTSENSPTNKRAVDISKIKGNWQVVEVKEVSGPYPWGEKFHVLNKTNHEPRSFYIIDGNFIQIYRLQWKGISWAGVKQSASYRIEGTFLLYDNPEYHSGSKVPKELKPELVELTDDILELEFDIRMPGSTLGTEKRVVKLNRFSDDKLNEFVLSYKKEVEAHIQEERAKSDQKVRETQRKRSVTSSSMLQGNWLDLAPAEGNSPDRLIRIDKERIHFYTNGYILPDGRWNNVGDEEYAILSYHLDAQNHISIDGSQDPKKGTVVDEFKLVDDSSFEFKILTFDMSFYDASHPATPARVDHVRMRPISEESMEQLLKLRKGRR
jgi:hypothetical protein